MIHVVVAEADPCDREATLHGLERYGDIRVVGTASDGTEALTLVQQHKPDVLVCGLMLSGLDGFALLKKISLLEDEVRPSVIVLSSLTRMDLVQRAMDMGAADYLIKPGDPAVLAERISEHRLHRPQASPVQTTLLDDRLTAFLLHIGIPPHLQGFHYLHSAALLLLEGPELLRHLTHDLYPLIARQYGTTPTSVERSIRTAISTAWDHGMPALAARLPGMRVLRYDKPTTGELLALMLHYLKTQRYV